MNRKLTSSPAHHSRNARLLLVFSAAAIAAVCLYYGITAYARNPLHVYEGLLILILATLPALKWAKDGGRHLPLFEVLMLTTANTYALPILTGQPQLRLFSSDTLTSAAFAVIVYQLVAIGTYWFVRGAAGRSAFFTREVISHNVNRTIGYGLCIATIYTMIATFSDTIPGELVGIFRAVFYGIGLVAVFVLARRWGAGELNPSDRAILVVNIAIQAAVEFSTLFLVSGLSMLVLALVGYVSGSRRIPVILAAFLLGGAALLHNGKGAMRDRYWDVDGTRHQPRLTELPVFFSDWLQAGLSSEKQSEAEESIANKLVERTSLFHILCLVVARTPESLPYLAGETYGQIPAQFVPRIFWPEKPLSHVSTSTLSVYYGLQREEDTEKTTIGFGMIAEAYANFGLPGIAILACCLGAFYKKIHTLAIDSPLLSNAGLVQIVLMAWSFQTEFPLSLWLSSMTQALIAVLGLPFVIRMLAG